MGVLMEVELFAFNGIAEKEVSVHGYSWKSHVSIGVFVFTVLRGRVM